MIRVLTALLATALLAPLAHAGEEKIELDKLPKAVKDAVTKRFPKAKLIEAAKEEDDKKKVEYEVTLKDGETKYDVMLTPEGAITLIEKTIAVSDLPKAVSAAIAKAYLNAKVTLAEEMTVVKDGKESLDHYEAVVETADKKTLELEVSPDGTIKKTEDKTAEKKEEKKNEKKDKK